MFFVDGRPEVFFFVCVCDSTKSQATALWGLGGTLVETRVLVGDGEQRSSVRRQSMLQHQGHGQWYP